MYETQTTLIISKKYEELFVEINKHLSQTESIELLSDLFISAIAVKMKWDNFLPQLLFLPYNSEEQKNLFDKNISTVNEIIDKKVDLDSFEKAFGIILEKHINRKTTGSYYTPEDTTKFICWNSIFISILNRTDEQLANKIQSCLGISNNVQFIEKKLPFETKIKIIKSSLQQQDINSLANTAKKIRIIDPTCGSGAFILSAYDCIRYLNENLFDGELNSKVYYTNLFGVDIEEDAVILCKTRLIIRALLDNTISNHFIKVLNSNFIVADSLNGSDFVITHDGAFNWTQLKKFDCIIGNPPYVEVKNKEDYAYFTVSTCGNLYAYTIERSCNIVSNKGIISFIVPLPMIATPRMKPIKSYLESKSDIVFYATFADRPGCVFSGVHQRLTIFFASIGTSACQTFTSSYNFWYNRERDSLFTSLDFIKNNYSRFPKIGLQIEDSIYGKSILGDSSVLSLTKKSSNFPLYVSSRIGFWAKAFIEKPSSKEISVYYFDNDIERRVVYCLINSSYFYFSWILISDCWHITRLDLDGIRFNYSQLTESQLRSLIELSDILETDLEKNKVRINSKQTDFEYKHKYSKKIIDKIDDIICTNVGLNAEETSYVKNYALKYRINNVGGMGKNERH